ncbi:uncharacterized protein LOC141831408 [Curcuma longa]|uniref:uncharacterized protein LOC141831408 n=1 Tax=Curcuma longa TaxID=136217 RepID=UPI003D9EC2A7
MCDFFWPRMEGYRGDLTDIVISGSRSHAELESVAADDPMGFPSSRSPNNNNNNNNNNNIGGDEPNFAMVRPCDDLLGVLQISPGGGEPAGVLTPSPAMPGSVEMEISSTSAQGIKRRKGQAKRVVCIPAPVTAAAAGRTGGEVVPSDLWAWRKYGQKPIKGSPYPRGYYKCSSSKGCSARKQVERSRTNPNMLVITYTSEHNHPWPTQRNALAGSTRCHPLKNPKPPSLWKEEPTERVKDGALCAQATEEEDDLDLITSTSRNFVTDGNSEEEEEKDDESGVKGFMGTFN